MIINRIFVHNYGVFESTSEGRPVEFDLRPSTIDGAKRPIVLFGGKNGAGKSTLFDGIRLCLYGQESLGIVSLKHYHDFLRDRIYRADDRLIQPYFASVGLDFDYSHFGRIDHYRVERRWEDAGSRIREFLIVNRNGKELDEIEKDYWQDFIKEMIPQGVSQLYFFDGEKIQKMLTHEHNEQLAASIKSLIGLDLFDRLESDLKQFRVRVLKQNADETLRQELQTLETEMAEIEAQITKERNMLGALRPDLEKYQEEIGAIEQKIKVEGGGYYQRREELKAARVMNERGRDEAQERLRVIASGILPAAFCPSIAKDLLQHADAEEHAKIRIHTNRILDELEADLLDAVNACISTDTVLAGRGRKTVDKELSDKIRGIIDEARTAGEVELNFDFSRTQYERLSNEIRDALGKAPQDLKTLTNEIERFHRAFEAAEEGLKLVPHEDMIRPLFEKLNRLNILFGRRREEVKSHEEAVLKLQAQFDERTKRRDKILERDKSERTRIHKMDLATRAGRVIGEYRRRVSALKIKRIEKAFQETFKKLHRKEDMVRRIEIHPETFDINLYADRRRDAPVQKDSLSSGESEIFSMSMLWALARVSGQTLPFIIDTPLGRLDSDHRKNLIERFFPYASHQVVIFSTDTEVDRPYFESLKPHIARSYHLDYDQKRKSSLVREEYFWS